MPNKSRDERMKIRTDHPDSWIAVDENDTIVGKIVDVTDAWSDQRRDPVTNRPGSLYPLLVLEAQEATGYDNLPRELKVHAFGAVLFNEVMRKQPDIGDSIRITYLGTGTARPGQNPPERYTVRAAAGADVARRAYASVAGAESARPSQRPAQQPQSELPVSAEDFDQSTGADEDLPY